MTDQPAAVGRLLEAENLWRRHPGPVTAVRDVSLTVSAGDFVAITGASGSGKTSLLALLGLLDTPSHGTYRILGADVTSASETQRAVIRSRVFGFVFQSFNLLPARTAADNVTVGMLYTDLPRNERHRRAAATLEMVGLSHRAHATASTLSGGEQQRVAIARAIAGAPRVLLCDEPTGNLDSQNTSQLCRLLENLNRRGLTIVIVTHDPTVAGTANATYEMADGILARKAPSLPVSPPGA
jgi:putative ABC transport system ATP-binding protein